MYVVPQDPSNRCSDDAHERVGEPRENSQLRAEETKVAAKSLCETLLSRGTAWHEELPVMEVTVYMAMDKPTALLQPAT